MTDTTFVNKQTVVVADWMNDANAVVYRAQSAISGSTNRTALSKLADFVSVKDFGAVGDGIADDSAALAAAIAHEQASKKGLMFPGGTYLVTSTLAFLGGAYSDLTFWANGKVTIHSTASGVVASLDSGGVSARADNISLLGDWVFTGNASTTYALFCRGLISSKVEARAVNCATAAFLVHWGVLTDYTLTCSTNIDTFTTSPQYGLILNESTAGNYPADCSFDCRFEGAPTNTGIAYLKGGLGNRFTGTCEAVPAGFTQDALAGDAIIFGMDFEANSQYDVSVSGTGLSLIGVNSASAGSQPNISVTATAAQVHFTDCPFLRQVDVDAAAVGVSFSQCGFSDNVSLGITGAGSVKVFGCYKVNTSGVWTANYTERIGVSGTWTPSFVSSGGGAQGAVTTAVGTYNAISSKMCYVQASMTIAKGTLAAGNLSVAGLPFQARNTANDVQYLPAGEWSMVTLGAGYTSLSLAIAVNGTTATLVKSGTGVAGAPITIADFPDPIILRFSGIYETV